jgi:hypothetical protein
MNINQKKKLENYISKIVKKTLLEGKLKIEDISELMFEFDSFGGTFDLKLDNSPLYQNEKTINININSSADSKTHIINIPDSLLKDFQKYMIEEDTTKKEDMMLDIGKRMQEYITVIKPKLQSAIDKFDEEIMKILQSNTKVLK